MSKTNFITSLKEETQRLAALGVAKSPEIVISKYDLSPSHSPQAVISDKQYILFNSNDYLGLRFHPQLIAAEHDGSQIYGTGPGAVRFISGTLQIHKQLELAIANYHGFPEAIVFSSAFAANFSTISALAKGQSQDSLVSSDTLVISDQLNHRSIVDGIRVSTLPSENRQIYRHLDYAHLAEILTQNLGKFPRVMVISDGVFSMLGEIVDLLKLREICDLYDSQYPQGVLLYIDDAHGIGVIGETGRGTQEYTHSRADVLVGTFGKAFGCDGGYVAGGLEIITYLREAASGYIYSNNLSPGTASAALAAVNLVSGPEGVKLLTSLKSNIALFKKLLQSSPVRFAAVTSHAIQPLLIGDPQQAQKFKNQLFDEGILVTAINYPVVPKGQDEIRIQISASHTSSDLEKLTALVIKYFPK